MTRTGWTSERFNSSCKQCHGEKTAARKKTAEYKAQQREYRRLNRAVIGEKNREYVKRVPSAVRAGYTLKSKYGITAAEYAGMVDAQGGVCKVCGRPPKKMGPKFRLHVDHDHASGKVRGLLCHHCNVTLGLVNDNQDILAALISYLRENGV